jgi:hypothetical protein
VSKAQPTIALASPRVASAPLRQWGKGEEGSSEASDALYRWDVTTPPSAALASVAEPPGQSARGYSRLKLYLLAFVVAALIVGAYMALAGTGGNNDRPSDDEPSQEVPAAEPTPDPEPAAESTPSAIGPAAETPQTGATTPAPPPAGHDQPVNSLSLTFESPPSASPTAVVPNTN